MAYTYTPEQLAVLHAGNLTNVSAAAAIGVTEATVRRYRAKHGITRELATPQDGQVTDGPSEDEILRAEVKQLRAQLRRTDRDSVSDERVLRAIEDAVSRVEPYAPRPVDVDALRPKKGSAPHHRQIALWSDWHAGEVISAAQMNGINAFNWSILEDRVDQLVVSTLKFQRVRPELTGLDIWALGDMASGAIHALEETNEIPAAEQYVRVGHLMANAIERLAPFYKDISCAGIVGNHPRPGKEPASKDAYNSGDWIAYQMAKALTRDLDNVTWEIPRGGMVVRTVAGRNFLLWHGDGVRSSMPGVPWGGVVRRVNVLKDTYAAMGTRIDYVVVGHFHQRCIVPGVYMNGSLCGPNEYSVKNFGGGEPPKQLLLTFDEARGRETDVSTVSFEGR
jgi:hypothetical protein